MQIFFAFKKLKKEFERIKSYGKICNEHKSPHSVGTLFEELLGKKKAQLSLPDYEGIEIKTKKLYQGKIKQKYFTLFHEKPSSVSYQTKEFLDTYGYGSSHNEKVLNMSIYSYKKVSVISGYSFQLFVNEKKKRLELHCYDETGCLIDASYYWSFKDLKKRLYQKMKYLAFVFASVSYYSSDEFVQFQTISFYILRDFSFFLFCIKQGCIRVSFKIGYFRDGPRKGEVHDHGVGFELRFSDLETLYEKVSI